MCTVKWEYDCDGYTLLNDQILKTNWSLEIRSDCLDFPEIARVAQRGQLL